MADLRKTEKPYAVKWAEWALWAWSAWTCLFGFYETCGQIPDFEKTMTDDFQGSISVAPQTLLWATALGYAVFGAISGWIVFRIGAGKHWARNTLMWGFACEIVVMLLPPYHPIKAADFLKALPDLGLQIYALYLLYTYPGAGWFQRVTSQKI